MKKLFSAFIITLLTLVSCSNTPEEVNERKLSSISLSGNYQTEFTVGDTFTYAGLVVTAHYDDNTAKRVNNFVVTPPNMGVAGEKDVVVSYEDTKITKTATYQIMVKAKEQEQTAVLSSIALSGTYQTEFTVGDTFNYTGLLVTATYSDGSTKVVTNYQFTPPDMTKAGIQAVYVAFSEGNITKETSYNVTIKAVPQQDVKLSSISLSGNYPKEFTVGDTFTYQGLVVTAHYDDNSSKEVTGYTVSNPNMSEAGTKSIEVSYSEKNVTKTSSYNITVNEQEEESLPTVFNEPYLNRQYYLNHIGDIYSVWQKYRGKGVTIAVIDSAFDASHEDLKRADGTSKVSSKSASFTYNGNKVTTTVGVNAVQDLSDSHGTFCAGVAAAAINGKGVIGVAPEADLMLLKTDKKPKSIVEAFKYAADNGAKVVTISIGSYYNYEGDLVNDGSDLSTVFNSATTYCVNKGVVVCSAAGNGGDSQPTEYTFPGASDNVIGCGGLESNSSGEIWSGTSYNSSKTYQFVDVFAPANNMFNICNFQRNGKQVLYDGGWDGTSFASPIVAGLAALYFEKYPNNTAKQFESALYTSCHTLNDSTIATANQLGYGRVDVMRLLDMTNDVTVTLKVKSNWSNMYVYAWNSDLTLQKELRSWPGASMSKNGNYFTYTINVNDYDSILFSDGNTNKTVDLLSSSFLDSYTYDISLSYKENGLFVGSYVS